MKKTISILLLIASMFTRRSIVHGETELRDNQVVIYDMKEDPTLAQFLGRSSVEGFFGLEIDEWKGAAAILYRIDDVVYRTDVDLKVNDQQLILKNGKRRKTLIRAESGGKQEIVYPVECPPAKGGWRYGPSFGRHVVRRDDEAGQRIIVSAAHLEFQIAQERCQDPQGDCGPVGCGQAEVALSSAPVKASAPKPAASPSPTPAAVPLSKALLEAKLGEREMIDTYKNEIDVVLPPKVNDLTAISTGYRTTALPYPGMSDPTIEQRGLKIGVISKKYLLEDKITPLVVEIEPLLADFQAPLPNKCGTWDTGPNKTFFDVRGRPALYIQTPSGGSSLYVCGQTVSISLQTQANRSQENLRTFFEALPFDQMERLVGPSK